MTLDEAKVAAKHRALTAIEAFYVTLGTERNAKFARLADDALDPLIALHEAAARVDEHARWHDCIDDGWCEAMDSPDGIKATLDKLIAEVLEA